MIDPLTFIALLPAVVLVVYICRKDRTDKEPPALLAKLLASGAGGRKNVGARRFAAVLNQADTSERQAAGKTTQEILQTQYGVTAVLTQFTEEERA